MMNASTLAVTNPNLDSNAIAGLNFPSKLWHLASHDKTGSIWWSSNGDFVVIDTQKFEKNYLKTRVFKTEQLDSIVRQFNLYNFLQFGRTIKIRDLSDRGNTIAALRVYSSPYFKRDSPHLLPFIKRAGNQSRLNSRTRAPSKNGPAAAGSGSKQPMVPASPDSPSVSKVQTWTPQEGTRVARVCNASKLPGRKRKPNGQSPYMAAKNGRFSLPNNMDLAASSPTMVNQSPNATVVGNMPMSGSELEQLYTKLGLSYRDANAISKMAAFGGGGKNMMSIDPSANRRKLDVPSTSSSPGNNGTNRINGNIHNTGAMDLATLAPLLGKPFLDNFLKAAAAASGAQQQQSQQQSSPFPASANNNNNNNNNNANMMVNKALATTLSNLQLLTAVSGAGNQVNAANFASLTNPLLQQHVSPASNHSSNSGDSGIFSSPPLPPPLTLRPLPSTGDKLTPHGPSLAASSATAATGVNSFADTLTTSLSDAGVFSDTSSPFGASAANVSQLLQAVQQQQQQAAATGLPIARSPNGSLSSLSSSLSSSSTSSSRRKTSQPRHITSLAA